MALFCIWLRSRELRWGKGFLPEKDGTRAKARAQGEKPLFTGYGACRWGRGGRRGRSFGGWGAAQHFGLNFVTYKREYVKPGVDSYGNTPQLVSNQ